MNDAKVNPEDQIYMSQAEANAALPRCPRPKGGQLEHWYYMDNGSLECAIENDQDMGYCACICGTCGQKMRLSLDANEEEFPAI